VRGAFASAGRPVGRVVVRPIWGESFS